MAKATGVIFVRSSLQQPRQQVGPVLVDILHYFYRYGETPGRPVGVGKLVSILVNVLAILHYVNNTSTIFITQLISLRAYTRLELLTQFIKFRC